MKCNTMLREAFRQEAKKHVKGNKFIDKPCPDAWFSVKAMRNSIGELPYEGIEDLTNEKVPKLIFILESPHIDEFRREEAPVPANGKTGKFLRSFWGRIFQDAYSKYLIVLVNAIQFQCSLGHSPINGSVRDCVFQTLIKQKCFGEDLCSRISGIVSNQDVIFNACTTGKCRIKLESRALNNKEYVRNALSKFEVIDIPHPSSWRFHWKKVKEIVTKNLDK